MRGPNTFVEVFDNVLHDVVWYNREGSSKVSFLVHHQKVILHFNLFEVFCKDFTSGKARRNLVLRGRLSNFDPSEEREELVVASLCSCKLLLRRH